MADATMTIANINAVAASVYKTHGTKPQFNRGGDTSRWFTPRSEPIKGERWLYWAYTKPFTGTVQTAWATAAAAEFPASKSFDHTRLSYDHTDLTMFQATGSINIIADAMTKPSYMGESKKIALYDLVTAAQSEIDDDMSAKLNTSLWQNSVAKIGTVKEIYAVGGGAYSTHATAFIRVTDAAISQIVPGETLTVGADTVTVNDVITGKDGPHSAGTYVADIGPGFTCTTADVADLDGVAADEDISRSGDTSNFMGFPSFFNPYENVFNDEDHAAINRDLLGNAWSIPTIIHAGTAAVPETLNLDVHMREAADTLPSRVKTGRKGRKKKSPYEAVNLPEAMVMLCDDKLSNDVTMEAQSTQQFLSQTASSYDAATKKKLFGETGFEGMVFHSATLKPIAIQNDPLATPHTMTLVDPSSFFWLKQTVKGESDINWVRNDSGGIWHVVLGTNNKLTFQAQSGCWTSMLLGNDQPGANAQIRYVKSSAE